MHGFQNGKIERNNYNLIPKIVFFNRFLQCGADICISRLDFKNNYDVGSLKFPEKLLRGRYRFFAELHFVHAFCNFVLLYLVQGHA